MQVVIAGGHGKIAQLLTRLLVDRGDQVRSLIRNPDHADEIRGLGAEPVVCDLEAAGDDDVAAAAGAADVAVFAAGAGPGSGSARKDTMDHGGAVKLMAAAKANGIPRYVIVSSVNADPDAPGDDTFAVYLRAKGKADADLVASGLGYAIVRPGALTDAPATGRVHAAEQAERGEIPRADVAAVLAALVHEPAATALTFGLVSGDTPIEDAVRALLG